MTRAALESLLADLARAKAVFQQRTIRAMLAEGE